MARNLFNPGRLPVEQTPDALKRRAEELYDDRRCPHCGNDISLWEALAMVHGNGAHYVVRVRDVETGREYTLDISEVNPQISILLPTTNDT